VAVVVEDGLDDEGAGVVFPGDEPGDQLPVRPEVAGLRGVVVGHAAHSSRKPFAAPPMAARPFIPSA
jgi:hypothetical protein